MACICPRVQVGRRLIVEWPDPKCPTHRNPDPAVLRGHRLKLGPAENASGFRVERAGAAQRRLYEEAMGRGA